MIVIIPFFEILTFTLKVVQCLTINIIAPPILGYSDVSASEFLLLGRSFGVVNCNLNHNYILKIFNLKSNSQRHDDIFVIVIRIARNV